LKDRLRPFGKRTLDIVVAFGALLVLLPLLAVISLAVAIDSRGPVFFTQERLGRNGCPFRIIKFRTMTAGRVPSANVSPSGDPRTTRVGAYLRATFLDELPQLVNVLVGDMSLVGPRPETPEFVDLYSALERRTLCVRPGMTGPSTLAYSFEEANTLAGQADPLGYYVTTLLHDRARLDADYVDSWTFLGDLRLMARTVGALLARRSG